MNFASQSEHNMHVNGWNHTPGAVNGVNRTYSGHTRDTNNDYVKTGVPPIAICGMSMRLPGGINTANDFWDLLINKRDGKCLIPEDRFNVDAFSSPYGKTGTIKNRHGYFLHDKLEHFDASFFSMGRKEVEMLDPQQRMLLEVTRECFENAGESKWRGKRIGCYVGVFGEDWIDLNSKDNLQSGMYRVAGTGDFSLANRISYEYDLHGPSMTIKTGCSASLVALHEACQALYSGECEAAVVGGTNMILTPTMSIAMTAHGVLSPTGSCYAFDANADGYARGEAVNAIYIKTLDDALKDSNPIRAVIRATSTNSDGKTQGITNPSPEAHEAMIRRAYRSANISDLSQTAFVECHGTGTQTGDPLEVNAIANAYGDQGMYIGSVKANMGHSEGASGITSMIKMILALEHRTIPPQIKFKTPNPKIPFQEKRLQVPLDPVPWPADRKERISINSFGIGGANAHVILESASMHTVPLEVDTDSEREQLLVISAWGEESLKKLMEKYCNYVESRPTNLAALAYTLGARREHLPNRAFCVTNGKVPLTFSNIVKSSARPKTIFVFTGQGAQWPLMGVELLKNPTFSKTIERMEDFLSRISEPCEWSIRQELLKPAGESQVHHAEYSQPLCTAVQVALVNLLSSAGVAPSAVVGHSSGEIAGAYACGAISETDAIKLAYYRGKVSSKQTQCGGMGAVGLGRKDVSPYLIDGVLIACENSPQNVTLSGDEEQLDYVLSRIKHEKPNVLARRLQVDVAYHSHHMQSVGKLYRFHIGDTEMKTSDIPFVSSVTGQRLASDLDAAYWQQNLESPVLFNSAVSAILDEIPQDLTFLEIGPHSALAGPLRQIFKAKAAKCEYLSTLTRGEDSEHSFLTALGNLHLKGSCIDFTSLSDDHRVLTDLPIYPWRHQEAYWNESRITKQWRLRKFLPHDLLGSRISEGNDLEPTWRNILRLDDVPWIRDHQIQADIVFPFVAYVATVSEAVRQIAGGNITSVRLRHVYIGTAMVLHEGKDIEISTSLRPSRLTDFLDSDWYDFTICSFTGSVWTKHGTGQIKPNRDPLPPSRAIEDLPRPVSSVHWYEVFRKVGYRYGPAFKALYNISASPTSMTAAAEVKNQITPRDSLYFIHPTTLDCLVHLFSAAQSQGRSRYFKTLSLPIYMEDLHIGQCEPDEPLKVKINSSKTLKGMIFGDISATAHGRTVFHADGVKLAPVESEELISNTDPHAGARLEWHPDIDLVDLDSLVGSPGSFSKETVTTAVLLETLGLLCMVETNQIAAGYAGESAYLKRYFAWIQDKVQIAQQGRHEILRDGKELAGLYHADRLNRIQNIRTCLSSTEAAAASAALVRVLEVFRAGFPGPSGPLEDLLMGNVLTDLYNSMQTGLEIFDNFLRVLSHSRPTLRVLEVGAGTGGATSSILSGLASNGEQMYGQYYLTDISTGFFRPAKERFQQYSNIEYKLLDISQDPVDQGFITESFDLVFASNALHTTPNLLTTLQNVRKLLKPNGYLFFQELCPTLQWPNYILGSLPGWWLDRSDGRSDEPFVNPEEWDQLLRNAGFVGAEVVRFDYGSPYQINAGIISKPVNQARISTRKGTVRPELRLSLLAESGELASQAESELRNRGCDAEIFQMDQKLPPDRDVISLLDLDSPFFHDMGDERFEAFKLFIKRLPSVKILWLMKSSQFNVKDPRYCMSLGVMRTLRSEYAMDLATLEIDTIDSKAWDAIVQVFDRSRQLARGPQLDPDFEFSLRQGTVNIGRYHWKSVSRELSQLPAAGDVAKLTVTRPGNLSTLQWVREEAVDLVDDQVEIATKAVGLNFKDILIAMGVIDTDKRVLGLEGAGIVRQIGPHVQNLHVGDRVMYFGTGCFSTRFTSSEQLCYQIPENLSFEDAATMPCVYGTAIHSLVNVGNLERGQSILVHSACGGVGLAALQICRMVGAEVYATVGNDEKVKYLMDTFHIPRNRIFNSRNLSFYADVIRETDGHGVDIVLNSLSGELLHASWRCVAEFGKMIEIGKRDFIGFGKLNMELFEANRSFFGVDLARLCDARPGICNQLLKLCVQWFRDGKITSIRPVKLYEASAVEESFRYMQKAQHIGKIVVTMPENPGTLSTEMTSNASLFDSTAAYFLVGGLRGIGKAVSTWMVERGAKYLVYLSRTAGKTEEDRSFVRELACQGCEAQVFAGSVANFDDVQNVVRISTRPIKGVIQLSAVFRDRAFAQMTFQDWEEATSPKVQGTWNLHRALKDPLEFFVLISSMSGVAGQWGQTNYNAANTFLDGFVQYRHSMGQPASVIDLGFVEDVGHAAKNPAVAQQLRATGSYPLSEQEIVDALQLSISQSYSKEANTVLSQLCIGLRCSTSFSDPSNRCIWRHDPRMAIYHNTKSNEVAIPFTTNSDLAAFLKRAHNDPAVLNEESSAEYLARQIGLKILYALLKPEDDLDLGVSPAQLGMDSLLAIEVQGWWKQTFGFETSVLEIMGSGSVLDLGTVAAEGLAKRLKKSHDNETIKAVETLNDDKEEVKDTEVKLSENGALI